MDNATTLQTIQLSDEELRLILYLTKLTDFPWLDEAALDPMLSDEQQAYGMMVAERALRSRKLARLNEDGALRIREDLLRLIGICAYAESSLYLTQILLPESVGVRFAVHQNGNERVFYQQPQPALHQFGRLGDWDEVIDGFVQRLGWPQNGESELDDALLVPADLLATVRAEAFEDREIAYDQLVAAGTPDPPAERLIDFLSKPHQLSVFQQIRRLGEELHLQAVTLLYTKEAQWLAVEVASDNDRHHYRLQPISAAERNRYLTEWITDDIQRPTPSPHPPLWGQTHTGD